MHDAEWHDCTELLSLGETPCVGAYACGVFFCNGRSASESAVVFVEDWLRKDRASIQSRVMLLPTNKADDVVGRDASPIFSKNNLTAAFVDAPTPIRAIPFRIHDGTRVITVHQTSRQFLKCTACPASSPCVIAAVPSHSPPSPVKQSVGAWVSLGFAAFALLGTFVRAPSANLAARLDNKRTRGVRWVDSSPDVLGCLALFLDTFSLVGAVQIEAPRGWGSRCAGCGPSNMLLPCTLGRAVVYVNEEHFGCHNLPLPVRRVCAHSSTTSVSPLLPGGALEVHQTVAWCCLLSRACRRGSH